MTEEPKDKAIKSYIVLLTHAVLHTRILDQHTTRASAAVSDHMKNLLKLNHQKLIFLP